MAKQYKIDGFLNDEDLSLMEFKRIVKNTILLENENELKSMMTKSSKCEGLKNESFGLKLYFKALNVNQTRTKFRLRTKMTQVKFNFKNDSKNSSDKWICDSCESDSIDSQSHIMWCTAYSHLRSGLNLNSDKDVVKYVTKVIKIRQDLKLTR